MSEALQKAIVKDFSENRLSFGFLARTSSNNPIRSFLNKTNSHYDPLQAIERDANSPYIDNNGGSIWVHDDFAIISKYNFAEHEKEKERQENGGYTDEQIASWEFLSDRYRDLTEDTIESNYKAKLESYMPASYYGKDSRAAEMVYHNNGAGLLIYRDSNNAVTGGIDDTACYAGAAFEQQVASGYFLKDNPSLAPTKENADAANSLLKIDASGVPSMKPMIAQDNTESKELLQMTNLNFTDPNAPFIAKPTSLADIAVSKTVPDERDDQVAGWVARDKQLAETKADITTSTKTSSSLASTPTVDNTTKESEPMEILIEGGNNGIAPLAVATPNQYKAPALAI